MIINHVKNLLTKILPVCSYFVPKKRRLWVFGCWSGRLYADNSKYFFEYVNKTHLDIEAVWLTRKDSIRDKVLKEGFKCYNRTSVRGIWTALRAEAAFITSDEISDISPLINRKRTQVIQLFHGIAPKGSNIFRSDKEKKSTQKRFSQYYWIATSEKYRDVFSEAYGINKDKFAITGYPRNDTFVDNPKNKSIEGLFSQYNGCRFVIYMPTHRGYGKRPIDISEFGYINEKFKENNIVMVYKPHFNELKNISETENEFSNIIIAKDQDVWGDVYSYLHYFDLLISDYSSIVYDFLCSNKPIVLYTYDMEYMKNEDFGLMDYFEAIPAGPFCFTWEETLNQTIKLLNKDDWANMRTVCRETFHPFKDGKNSERVYSAAVEWIG